MKKILFVVCLSLIGSLLFAANVSFAGFTLGAKLDKSIISKVIKESKGEKVYEVKSFEKFMEFDTCNITTDNEDIIKIVSLKKTFNSAAEAKAYADKCDRELKKLYGIPDESVMDGAEIEGVGKQKLYIIGEEAAASVMFSSVGDEHEVELDFSA